MLKSLIVMWLFFFNFLFGQTESNEILFLPWGQSAGIRSAPGGQFGPMSFEIQGNTIKILDTQHNSVNVYQDNKLIQSISIPSINVEDFCTKGNNSYYLLSDNKIYEYSNQKLSNIYSPDNNQQIISRLSFINNRFSAVLNQSNSRDVLSNKSVQEGIEDNSGNQVQVIKNDWNQIIIKKNNTIFAEITSMKSDLGSAKFLGDTPGNYIYIYFERITQQIPLVVKKCINMYSKDGSLIHKLKLPQISYSYIFKEFFVDKSGNFYHMLSTRNGIHILKWNINELLTNNTIDIDYPLKFNDNFHYNQIEEPDPIIPNEFKLKEQSYLFDPVSRDSALAKGNTYTVHSWIAAASNLTNGRIQDPDGIEIESPGWIHVGSNIKIPYKWGGFWTLAGFDNGLLNGKYAGDIATSGVSQHCVGVDCSGFVSQCWNLPYQFSTRMMDDWITIAYNSWSELLPADAIHKVGHVRMYVSTNTNGSLLTVESAGADWRVSYRSFSLGQLSNYTPRYYIYMLGSPATIARPVLNSITFSDSISLSLSLDDTSNLAGIKIYNSSDGTNWNPVLGGQLLSPELDLITIPKYNNIGTYFKCTCISSDTNSTESWPSDSYGYYSKGTSDKLLIVDGFDRIDGSYNLPYHGFATVLGKSIAFGEVSFETSDNDAVIDGSINLTDFDAVFWMLGDESTDEETFSSVEQSLVTAYLQQGGKMFISGSEIAWDLDYRGASSDQDFIHNYLKSEYNQDDAGSYIVNGEAGTIFDGLVLHYDEGTHGVYPEDYPDAFTPVNGSSSVLRYDNNLIAATLFEGMVPGGTMDAKIILMGFPFETVYDEFERHDLINRILTYFDFNPTSVEDNKIPIANTFDLYGNFPNPFNASTKIRFFIPKRGKVIVDLYNILGQKIENIFNGLLDKGIHEINYNGIHLASGTYIYTAKYNDFEKRAKLILLK